MTPRVLLYAPILNAALSPIEAAGFPILTVNTDRRGWRRALERGLPRCQAILCRVTDRIDVRIMEAAPALRVISSMSAGLDHVDLDAAAARRIRVCRLPDVVTEATADLTWALILAAARRVLEGDRLVRRGGFRGWRPDLLLGMDLAGRTLGVVGMGRIGRAVARRAFAFGMEVIYANRSPVEAPPAAAASFGELLSRADVVSVHVSMNEESRRMFDEAAFRRMKRSALFINTSRGAVADEKTLVRALQKGWIAGAGLDVYEREPMLAPGLKGLKNVVLMPHAGSATLETRERMARMAAENLVAALRRP